MGRSDFQTMEKSSIPVVLANKKTPKSRRNAPAAVQSSVSLFQDSFKSGNNHGETFEVIYQEAPSSTDKAIKVSKFPEFSSTAIVELSSGSIVTEANTSHLELSHSLSNQSQIIIISSDGTVSTSDFNGFPSVVRAQNIADNTQFSSNEKIYHTCESLCRICANETVEALALVHNNNLIEKIHRCLPIKILDNDDLPQQICEPCALKLETTDDFISLCVAGNSKLKSMAWMWTKSEEETASDVDRGEILSEPSETISESVTLVIPEGGETQSVGPKLKKTTKNHKNKQIKEKEPSETSSESVTVVILEREESQSVDPKFIHENQQIKEKEQPSLEPICPSTNEEKEMDDQALELEVINDCKSGESEQTISPEVVVAEDARMLSSPPPDSKCSKLVEKKRKVWSCSECDYKASRRVSLTLHKQQNHADVQNDNDAAKKETKVSQFSCQHCDKNFHSKTMWKKHLLTHTNSKEKSKDAKHQCDTCGKTFRLASGLDIHQATHSNEKPCLCDICGKSFKHNSNLRSHRRSHAEMKVTHPHSCDICPKTFRSKFHLSEHKNVHLDITPYPCNVCGKKFHRRIQLRQHRAVHDQASQFECPQCGAWFTRRGNMTEHLKRHLKERKFNCKVCEESFQTLSEVVQHRKEHTEEELSEHTTGKGKFSCYVCLQLFPSSKELASHLKAHSDSDSDAKYECEICNKRLSSRRCLDYHIKSFHTLERPLSCQHCSETFLSRDACNIHERLHTGEKPYTCSECNTSFRSSSNLAQHMSIHRNERPWPCAQCPKSFKRKGILLVHMRTHTGEKPFCCDICGRRFSQKNDMMKHQQTHSSAKQTFVCGDCNWRFHTRKELNKHRKTLHSKTGQSQPEVPSNSQALLITNDLCQLPITIVEEGGNVIVHQGEEGGKHPQIIELNASDSNPQILHFTDSLLETVVQDVQSQQVITFDGETVLPSQTDQNWLISQQK